MNVWWQACRPRTLLLGVAPVLVGVAAATTAGAVSWAAATLALAGSLLLQITSNLANDLGDFTRGADGPGRLGPARALASGALSATAVKRGIAVSLGMALVCGLLLTSIGGPVVVAIGVSGALAALAYTCGPAPLGYLGLGEVMVFLFFGPVAVGGTAWVTAGRVPAVAWWASLPVGALACAVLVVNNLRDRAGDAAVGKLTLAVRFGESAAVGEYAALCAVAFAAPIAGVVTGGPRGLLAPLLLAPAAFRLGHAVARERGVALNKRLGQTALLTVVWAVFCAGGLYGARCMQ